MGICTVGDAGWRRIEGRVRGLRLGGIGLWSLLRVEVRRRKRLLLGEGRDGVVRKAFKIRSIELVGELLDLIPLDCVQSIRPLTRLII